MEAILALSSASSADTCSHGVTASCLAARISEAIGAWNPTSWPKIESWPDMQSCSAHCEGHPEDTHSIDVHAELNLLILNRTSAKRGYRTTQVLVGTCPIS